MEILYAVIAGFVILLAIGAFLRWGTALPRSGQKSYSPLPDYDAIAGRVRDAPNAVQKGEPQNVRSHKE